MTDQTSCLIQKPDSNLPITTILPNLGNNQAVKYLLRVDCITRSIIWLDYSYPTKSLFSVRKFFVLNDM